MSAGEPETRDRCAPAIGQGPERAESQTRASCKPLEELTVNRPRANREPIRNQREISGELVAKQE